MLVLSRHPGDSIRIGENVIVTINRVEGRKVSVGIQAPSHVAIVRREIDLEAIANDDTVIHREDGE